MTFIKATDDLTYALLKRIADSARRELKKTDILIGLFYASCFFKILILFAFRQEINIVETKFSHIVNLAV